MTSINAKSVQKEAKRQERAERNARVKVPAGGYIQHMKNPFQIKYKNGEFRNEFYQHYKTSFIASVFIRNILLFFIPAMILHAPALLIDMVVTRTLGAEAAGNPFLPHIILIYTVATVLTVRRISHQMAYYNVMAINGRRTINSLQASSNVSTPQGMRELAVMDATRMKINKAHLFQSARETAIDKQENGAHADTIGNKQSEHFAAKAIADRKQKERGGVNEYDRMVRRYKLRTTPEIRDIIKQVQQFN